MRSVRMVILAGLAAGALCAQQVTVTASVDSPSVVIGDWIRYNVSVKHPSAISVVFPSLGDTLGSFDIVGQDSLVRREKDGETEQEKNFVIARYEAGNYSVPPFVVQYVGEDGTPRNVQSNPIPVEIRGIEVDTTQSIKDIKPPLTVPLSAEEIAVYVGIVLLLAAAAYAVYYYVRQRRKRAGLVEEPKPVIPAHVLALMQLEELEAKKLWQAGEVKAYYSEATEIVRRYFESRYDIMALEMTSGEVMAQLEKFSIEKNTFRAIASFLSDADLVKFAKYQPIAAENEQVIPQARMIVESTAPAPAAAATASPSL